MDKEQILALVKELKSGSNWLRGKHDFYSYNRAPKLAALVLEAVAELGLGSLVLALRDSHKWKLEGFGHFKDVTVSDSDAPFRAADLIESELNDAIESYKAELLKEVGEPVAYVHRTQTIGEQLSWYGESSNYGDENPVKLYTSDQVAAAILKATGPLEDQLAAAQEELQAANSECELFRNNGRISDANEIAELRDQLAKAEQRVAEACACRVEEPEKRFFCEFDSIGVFKANALREGEWRKFMKEGE